MLRFEFEDPRVTSCDQCGGQTTNLTRFVYLDDDAHAVYYASFCDREADRDVAAIISLGSWRTEGIPPERIAIALRLWAAAEEYNVEVVDAAGSPWRDAAILGRKLSRIEALAHPWISDAFHITDHIVVDDAPIRAFLDSGPNAPAA